VIRVVLITDRSLCPAPEMLARLGTILAAVPRGSVRVQIREKTLDGGPLLALVQDAIAIARPLGTEVWVNDRADVALAAAADGVHLPETGLAIADARALMRGFGGVGCSRHSREAAIAAASDGADVVHLGPIWATPSKTGEPLGTDQLDLRLGIPIVAVGGVDSAERAAEAVRAGADAVAVIRAAWTTADPVTAIAAIVTAAMQAGHRP
jgi:thiamine-phosphate pyrophosphorylase